MRFNKLSGDINWQKYGGKFVSRKLNNGDWDYWLVLEVINMWDATGDETIPQYYVQISAVSPDAAGQENLNHAISSCGFSDEQINEMEKQSRWGDLQKVEALDTYGIHAVLYHNESNNINLLIKLAHKDADLIEGLFGFYMDRPQNRLGQSGWDCIEGQSVRTFLGFDEE